MADENANNAGTAPDANGAAGDGGASGAPDGSGRGGQDGGAPPSGQAAAPPASEAKGEAPPKDKAVPEWAKGIEARFLGKTPEETAQKLAEAQRGFRESLSKYGPPVSDPKEFDYKPSEAVAPYIGPNGEPELVGKALDVLAKAGVGKLQGPAVLNGLLEMLVGLEVMDPPVDPARERALLIPEEMKSFSQHQKDDFVDRRMANAKSLLESFRANGLDEAGTNLLVPLMNQAAGIRALEFIAERMGARNPLTGHNAGAGFGEADLDKLIAETPLTDIAGQQKIREMAQRLTR